MLHWWSTTLQLVGSTVTALGLFGIYVRSRHGVTVIRLVRRTICHYVRRLFRTSPTVAAQPEPAPQQSVIGPIKLVYGGLAPVNLDPSKPLEDQLADLAAYVNGLASLQLPTDNELYDRKLEVFRLRRELSALRSETPERIEEKIQALEVRLNMAEVVDLRWAIIGLVITAVGVALGY